MTPRAWPALLLLAVGSAGCADASGRFDAFEDRRASLDGENGGAAGSDGAAGAAGETSCAPPTPGEVQGPALLAMDTATAPGIAILFLGQVTTPEVDGRTGVRFDYRALDATDRTTQVGEPLVVGPYAIGDDGTFDAPTAASTLPGSANAILPGVPITSELTLHGRICGVARFYCGTVTGTVSSPIKGPASGNFGLQLLDHAGQLPPRPRFGCAEDALAPELPKPAG